MQPFLYPLYCYFIIIFSNSLGIVHAHYCIPAESLIMNRLFCNTLFENFLFNNELSLKNEVEINLIDDKENFAIVFNGPELALDQDDNAQAINIIQKQSVTSNIIELKTKLFSAFITCQPSSYSQSRNLLTIKINSETKDETSSFIKCFQKTNLIEHNFDMNKVSAIVDKKSNSIRINIPKKEVPTEEVTEIPIPIIFAK